MATQISIESGAHRLRVQWSEGGEGEFPAVWLRDNCHCGECFTAGAIHVRTLLMEHLDVNCTLTDAKVRGPTPKVRHDALPRDETSGWGCRVSRLDKGGSKRMTD